MSPLMLFLLTSSILVTFTLQQNNLTETKYCLEESTNERNPVLWPHSPEGNSRIISRPLCLTESLELVTRACNGSTWVPEFQDVPNCARVTTESPNMTCSPGYEPILKVNKQSIEFCYQYLPPSVWNYPCFNSGSTWTILDLDKNKYSMLLQALNSHSKRVWLPIKRVIQYGPLVWTMPGEKWGGIVNLHDLNKNFNVTRLSIVHDCLLLDLEDYSVISENCSFQYPTLCVADEEHMLQLHCPSGYFASQYGQNNGLCYGIQISDKPLTWDEFHSEKCPNPITINNQYDNLISKELFSYYEIDSDELCWIGLLRTDEGFVWQSNISVEYVNWDPWTNFSKMNTKGAVNGKFRWKIFDNETRLSCMICQTEIKNKQLEMELKYVSYNIQLIVYNQHRFWKDHEDDAGVRCFSNAKGFQININIAENDVYTEQTTIRLLDIENVESVKVQKTVYQFEPLNEQSGEYWCEGHDSKNFTLVKSPILYVPMQDEDDHVFVLKINVLNLCDALATCNPDWKMIAEAIEDILDVKNVRIMTVTNVTNVSATMVLHTTVSLISQSCTQYECRIDLTYKIFKLHVIHQFKEILRKNISNYQYEFVYLKSTEFCLPEKEANESLSWDMTKIGETTAPVELCMNNNGLPVTRKCAGTFVRGGDWGDILGNCSENFEPTNRTAFLYSVAKGRADLATTSTFLVNDLTTVLQNKEDIIPADIFFLGLSLRRVLDLFEMNSSSVEMGDSVNIATAINNVMDIEEKYLELAQTMNSSNILLESVDLILSKIALNTSDEHYFKSRKDLAKTSHFMIQISCPQVNNISGIAVLRNNQSERKSFEESEVVELTANMTLNDVLAIPDLDAATWVSQDLLDNLQHQNTSQNISSLPIYPRVIMEIFYTDVVFQETKKHKDVINTRVISVTIPEYETELSIPIYLVFRKLNVNATERECAYWDLGTRNSNGEWLKRGCYFVRSHGDLDVCACLHLTHFAQLVNGNKISGGSPEDGMVLKYHGQVLNAITVVGCSLSLMGVAGIAATALIFPAWRQKPGSKILLQLSAALALEILIMLAQDSAHPSDIHCITLGAILHYAVLATFMWMLITAILQFARYVKVLGVQRPSRFLIKFSILGWGLPIIPVMILLIIDPALYIPVTAVIHNDKSQSDKSLPQRDPTALCYPQGLGLVLGCLLPIACIVAINSIVFVLVMHAITRVPEGVRRPTDPDLVLSQLRLSILLFFLLGLSWIFGFLAATSSLIIFSYLFCVTATLQGFILFVYFIVCDPTTRVLWVTLVRAKSIGPSKSSTREFSIDTKS